VNDQLQPAVSGRSSGVTPTTPTFSHPSQLCINAVTRARSSSRDKAWRSGCAPREKMFSVIVASESAMAARFYPLVAPAGAKIERNAP
jgi:hypothetical protein